MSIKGEYMLEKDILDSLDDLNYNCRAESVDVDEFDKKLFHDQTSSEFTNLVHWLSDELQSCYKLEECVNKVSSNNDLNSFLLELSSFLKEMNCPYAMLIESPISERLASKENRLHLLDYLCTELQAARMSSLNDAQCPSSTTSSTSMQITESETAATLRLMLMSIGFPKPPATITAKQLFAKVTDKVNEQLSKVPKDHLGNPLFVGVLSEKQWQILSNVNDSMNVEYKGREEMLLKRLDVTVQSFTWSDRVKKREEELLKVYRPIRRSLNAGPRVSFVHLLAVRTDLLTVDKTSGKGVREKTQSKINKILMHGKVPDRGGRPAEIEPPPPEMPSWKQRSTGGGGPRGGGGAPQGPRQGGRGGGGGERVQGGWSSTGGREAAQSWGGGSNQNVGYAQRGGYNNQAGGYGGGAYDQGAHYGHSGQQQGAAYYQDYYNTGGSHQSGYHGDSDQKRGGGGGGHRGRGRGGGHGHGHGQRR